MSQRETHFQHISISTGQYQTIKDAIDDANALKVWLQRNCTKKAHNCICYIGVSEFHHGTGKISCGKRGKKEFFKTPGMKAKKVSPHIHIILLSNPAETLSKMILEYFMRKGISGYHKCCDKYLTKAIPYVMEQSSICRTVACDVAQLPSDMVDKFYRLAEATNKSMNGSTAVFGELSAHYYGCDFVAEDEDINITDPFTFVCSAGMQDLAEEQMVLRPEWSDGKLQCNNSKYNNPINQLREHKALKSYETIKNSFNEPRRGPRASAPRSFDISEFKNHPIHHCQSNTYFPYQRRLI